MQNDIEKIQQTYLKDLEGVKNLSDLEKLKLAYFGGNGKVTLLTKKIGALSVEEKKEFGKKINELKKQIEGEFALKRKSLFLSKINLDFDPTIPGLKSDLGHIHPQTQVLYDLVKVFNSLGFQVAEGPEIETDWYNFGSLNFPDEHPARDTQQSLHINTNGKLKPGESILRTQTSAMQVRVMEKTPPPLRVIVPGKCYRYDQIDASHGFEFWQLEGFVVDNNITLTDLFGTIAYILKKVMGENIRLRFACTNFPFVEPGVDTYIECSVCQGRGCTFCKQSGWSEIMPAGMIHPNVLKAAGINPDKWQGFAFAIGLSRAVTLRYGMNDLRLLVTPDLNILQQF